MLLVKTTRQNPAEKNKFTLLILKPIRWQHLQTPDDSPWQNSPRDSNIPMIETRDFCHIFEHRTDRAFRPSNSTESWFFSSINCHVLEKRWVAFWPDKNICYGRLEHCRNCSSFAWFGLYVDSVLELVFACIYIFGCKPFSFMQHLFESGFFGIKICSWYIWNYVYEICG